MKTTNYNPSDIEVKLARALEALREPLQKQLEGLSISGMETHLAQDNPSVVLHLEDSDGDKHSVTVKIIQRIDAGA